MWSHNSTSIEGSFQPRAWNSSSLKVTHLEMTGTQAVSHLTTDERQLEKRTGAALSLGEVFHGAGRALEMEQDRRRVEDRARIHDPSPTRHQT